MGRKPALRADVTIAPLLRTHAAAMFRWMCDPEIRNNIGLRREPSLKLTEDWIDAAKKDSTVLALAILCAEQHVGNVIFDRRDEFLSMARFSIYIGEASARGGGVGLAGAYRGIQAAFRWRNLHKIWLTVHTKNLSAIRLYNRLGFSEEGVLRDEFILEGQRKDVVYMGMIQGELRPLDEGA